MGGGGVFCRFDMRLVRTAISFGLAAFLTVSVLCAAGLLAHEVHCDGAGCEHAESHFGHEPAEDGLALPPSLAHLLAGPQLPALTAGDRTPLEPDVPAAARASSSFDPRGPNLPVHSSDLPLLS